MSGPLVIVGDSLLDVDVEGTADRLCPDAPVPVVEEQAEHHRPGGAGLAALLAARDGTRVVLITAMGDDPSGRCLEGLLSPSVEIVRLPLRGTTVRKTRVRARGQTLVRIDTGDGRAMGRPGQVASASAFARAADALASASAVLVADYGRGVADLLRERCAGSTCPWSGTPTPGGRCPCRDARWSRPARPRPAECARSRTSRRSAPPAGWCATSTPRPSRSRWASAARCWPAAAAGSGRSPSRTWRPERTPAARRPLRRGGGARPGGRRVHRGRRRPRGRRGHQVRGGGRAAALRLPRPAAESPVPFGPGASAFEVAAAVRAAGGRLIATGGCFDLLHAGHVSLLRRARALGDALVVCVNSDDSIRRLKGPSRPLVSERDRVEVLRALGCVDAVTVFDEDTPSRVIERLCPDVWVKGGDYDERSMPEAEAVRRAGGEVVILPTVPGYSTTGLIAAARAAS